MSNIIIYENSNGDIKVGVTFKAKGVVSELTKHRCNKYDVFKKYLDMYSPT